MANLAPIWRAYVAGQLTESEVAAQVGAVTGSDLAGVRRRFARYLERCTRTAEKVSRNRPWINGEGV